MLRELWNWTVFICFFLTLFTICAFFAGLMFASFVRISKFAFNLIGV